MDVNQPVVIDNVRARARCLSAHARFMAPWRTARGRARALAQGSGVIKAGFAGDVLPKCQFPALSVIAAGRAPARHARSPGSRGRRARARARTHTALAAPSTRA